MDLKLLEQFKSKLGQEPLIGMFMKSSDPAFVEVAGYAGLDFVILDTEHGVTSLETMQNNIRAAQIAGVFPVVRVADTAEHAISQPLDIGALGVQVPQIATAEQARAVVAAAKFHPRGSRGVCRFVRAAQYAAMPREAYFNEANGTMVILQLEGKQAIENLSEILDVDGIDILFVGPYDLSQSLGVPGNVTHPTVVQAMSEIVTRAKEKNITVGTFVDSIDSLRTWKAAGVRYLAYSVDVGLFYERCRDLLADFKAV